MLQRFGNSFLKQMPSHTKVRACTNLKVFYLSHPALVCNPLLCSGANPQASPQSYSRRSPSTNVRSSAGSCAAALSMRPRTTSLIFSTTSDLARSTLIYQHLATTMSFLSMHASTHISYPEFGLKLIQNKIENVGCGGQQVLENPNRLSGNGQGKRSVHHIELCPL